MKFFDLPLGARAMLVVVGLVMAAAAWTVLASLLFLLGTGLLARFGHPFYQWWIYLPYAGQNGTVRTWLIVSGATASLFIGGAAVIRVFSRPRGPSLRRPFFSRRPRAVMRATTDNLGHADWLAPSASRKLFPGPEPTYGGIVVGEAYRVDQDRVAPRRFDPRDRRTWGKGGKAPLLIDPCVDGSTHSLVIAGPGGFKSTSAVSTLLTWTGSAVVLDVSGELGPMLAEARQAMGHTVALIDASQPEECAFNVLAWIDPSAPDAEVNVQAVAGWICGEPPRQGQGGRDMSDFFQSWGRQLVTCLLAHMLWSDLPEADKTLRTLRVGIVTPEKQMRTMLEGIHASSNSPLAQQLASALRDIVDETFSGIYANANEATGWLSIGTYADLVSGSSFRAADITAGALTVFVQIPLKALQTTPAIGRTIIGALLNAAYEARGDVQGGAGQGVAGNAGGIASGGRVLFLLDEVARLGRMGILETARDAGRKYGITLQLLYQSVGQLVEQWGPEGKRAWYDAVSWRAYAAVQDMDTAKEVSAACGEFGVLATSQGGNRGSQGQVGRIDSVSRGQTQSFHEIRRALIRPEELTQDARTDELFVIPRSSKPLRCGRAIYFRRPELAARVAESRFFKTAAE